MADVTVNKSGGANITVVEDDEAYEIVTTPSGPKQVIEVSQTASPTEVDVYGRQGPAGQEGPPGPEGPEGPQGPQGPSATVDGLSDTTITAVTDNELLAYHTGTGEWINQTAAEAGLSDTAHTHTGSTISALDTGDVTTGTFADARLSQSSVTQHQAALTITESQISNLSHLTLEQVQDDLGVTSLVGGTNIDKVYDDGAGTITLNINTTGLDADTLDGAEGSAYQLVSAKGANNGYASLDGSGKVPSAELPALALTDVSVVADIPARDGLTVQEGDVAIVTGTSETYIYDGTAWQEMVSPTDGVTAVTGGTGITSSGGTTPKISITAGGVGPTQLATNAVTNIKVADNAIDTAEIVNGAVTEAKLAFTRTKRVSGLMGDATNTALVITHNLGTRDVIAMVYEAGSPYQAVMADVESTTINSTTFTFATAPATDAYRYVLMA